MSSCTNFSCYLLSLKKSAELQAKLDREHNTDMTATELAERMRHASGDDLDTLNRDPSNFRIVFPVVLVVCILVVICVGFLLYRLVSSVAWNNWALQGDVPIECAQRGRFRRRRGDEIRTVSSGVDLPPTYRQVMKTKKAETLPPTYSEVISGAVNCGYVSEEDLDSVLQRYRHDEDLESEKRNTNSLIYARTRRKSDEDDFTVIVHTADIFGFTDTEDSDAQDDSARESHDHVTVAQRNSVESSASVNTVITVADVNITYSDHPTSPETVRHNNNDRACSAV